MSASQIPAAEALVALTCQPVDLNFLPSRRNKNSNRKPTVSEILAARFFAFMPCGTKAICRLCHPSITNENITTSSMPNMKLYAVGKQGYSWARQHVRGKHKDCLLQEKRLYGSIIPSVSIPQESIDTYLWLKWITEDNLPLYFVDLPHVKENVLLTKISTRTLKRRLLAVN